jgi:hypothetical protein
MNTTREQLRLEEERQRVKYWKRRGLYLSERAWGSVREDYSPGGDLIFEGTESSAVVFESMQVLARNGVLVLTSITGGIFERLQNPSGAIEIFCEVATA